jgi:hypothetical protein
MNVKEQWLDYKDNVLNDEKISPKQMELIKQAFVAGTISTLSNIAQMFKDEDPNIGEKICDAATQCAAFTFQSCVQGLEEEAQEAILQN